MLQNITITTTMETNIKASDDIAKDWRWYGF
jgi:hypothetical protein